MPSLSANPFSLAATRMALSSKRHEAGDDLVVGGHCHLSSGGASRPAAVIRLSAISEILRFWFMAVLRSSP